MHPGGFRPLMNLEKRKTETGGVGKPFRENFKAQSAGMISKRNGLRDRPSSCMGESQPVSGLLGRAMGGKLKL